MEDRQSVKQEDEPQFELDHEEQQQTQSVEHSADSSARAVVESVKAQAVQVLTNHEPSSNRATVTPSKAKKPKRGFVPWCGSNLLRLLVWYSIITVIFRCPQSTSHITEHSPRICTPYLEYVQPHLKPYYQEYAQPYVLKLEPYITRVHGGIITPVTRAGAGIYNRIAAPQVEKLKLYATSIYNENAAPQIAKVQEASQQIYDDNLAASVQKASEIAGPYLEVARENVQQIQEKHIVPAIALSQPHLRRMSARVYQFAMTTVVPTTKFMLSRAIIFVEGKVWPALKGVYGNNIRPQVIKISEQVIKYQQSKKLQAVADEAGIDENLRVATTATEGQISSTTIMTDTSASPIMSTTTQTSVSVLQPVAPQTNSIRTLANQPERNSETTDEIIASDLVRWQEKFSAAAEKGKEDLKARITDIVRSHSSADLGEAGGLVDALRRTIELQLFTVKRSINVAAATMIEDFGADDLASAEEDALQAVRTAGADIKSHAAAVRAWAERFDHDLQSRIGLTIESTLHVLDDIRDLGLQEIGIRWAYMDDVTYNHWRKYHDLKRRFADWREKVREDAQLHPATADALSRAHGIVEESMKDTQDAAKELIRLREVSKWKIRARDSSDDFDTRHIPVLSRASLSASSFLSGAIDSITSTATSTDAESVTSVPEPSVSVEASTRELGEGENAAILPHEALFEIEDQTNEMGQGDEQNIVPIALVPENNTYDVHSQSTSVDQEEQAEDFIPASQFSDPESTTDDTLTDDRKTTEASEDDVYGVFEPTLEAESSVPVPIGPVSSLEPSLTSALPYSRTVQPSEPFTSDLTDQVDSISTIAVSASEAVSASMLEEVRSAGDRYAEVTSSWLEKDKP